jgi:S2P endopeptidase
MIGYFLASLAAFYAGLFAFKTYKPLLAEQLYDKCGIDIGLFQLKISASAKGRWVSNIPSIRRTKAWFKWGTIVALLLMIPSVIFLVLNLWKLLQMSFKTTAAAGDTAAATSSTTKEGHEDLIFQPVIPGVNFPLDEVGLYGLSLLISTVFHELGHALAADCHDVKLLGYGLMVFFIIPAAFVDMSTSELTSLSAFEQLKVYTAGVWHNLTLALLAFLLLFMLPVLPGYSYRTEGITVTALNHNSTVIGPSGLRVGDVLNSVNECKVTRSTDFYDCLRQEAQQLRGHCLDSAKIQAIQCSGCCETATNNGSLLCFKAFKTGLGGDSDEDGDCLPVRQVLESRISYCSEHEPCKHGQECLRTDLAFPQEALWQIGRKGRKDFLFIGSVSQVYQGIKGLTDFVPQHNFLPLTMPLNIEKGLYYITSFSLALALINIIPCFMLDGQFAIKALVSLCWPASARRRRDCISNLFIYTGSLVLVANLALTFYVMRLKS